MSKNVIVSGQTVVVEGVLTAIHTGPLRTASGNFPPTGKQLALRYAGVYNVEGDVLTSAHVYFDREELMTQLGLVPAPVTPR